MVININPYTFGEKLKASRKRGRYLEKNLTGEDFSPLLSLKCGDTIAQQTISSWEKHQNRAPAPDIVCAILELLTFHGGFPTWDVAKDFLEEYQQIYPHPHAYNLDVPFTEDDFKLWQNARETIFTHLPNYINADPTHLIGIAPLLEKAEQALKTHAGITIEGLGGMGKTTLAVVLANLLGNKGAYEAIYFVGVRLGHLDEDGEAHQRDKQVQHSDEALAQLAEQIGITFLPNATSDDKLTQIVTHYRNHRVIVLLDNLETPADITEFTPLIQALTNNAGAKSRLIITSRHWIDEFRPTISTIALKEFTANALHEMLLKHDCDLTPQQAIQLHKLIGGNPLALRLFSKLIRRLGINEILNQLEAAASQMRLKNEDLRLKLFDYLYERILGLLDRPTYQFFWRIGMIYDMDAGTTIERIRKDLRTDTPAITAMLKTLVGAYLLNFDQAHGLYTMHRLTSYYIHKRFFPSAKDDNDAL